MLSLMRMAAQGLRIMLSYAPRRYPKTLRQTVLAKRYST